MAASKTAYVDAINNITQSTNTCGYADEVSASASYDGTTSTEADITAAGNCGERDSRSTIDGGKLPAKKVAITCAWSVDSGGSYRDLIQADIRFNTTYHSFNDDSTCSNQYDLRAILTHEVGHVFGLKDIYGAEHAWLTMLGDVSHCQTRARTLARGDVRGLRKLY